MSKHRRRRREEQRRLIQEWNESGESAAAFAARIGVASNTIYRWRAAVTGAVPNVPESALSRIVEVRAAAVPADTRFEIEVGGRRASRAGVIRRGELAAAATRAGGGAVIPAGVRIFVCTQPVGHAVRIRSAGAGGA